MALITRTLTGIVRCDGIDAEDIVADEPIHESRAVDQILIENQDTLVPLDPPGHFKWGGECRVELDFRAKLLPAGPTGLGPDQAIEVSGQARFFEGASVDTGELEDAKDFFFRVPRSLSDAGPIGFQVALRNSTVIGAEDHATVSFNLKNKPGPETE
ncbi:hypothetical protein [Streptomyces europaeiscabiei]|uniref:hypothetical protein n=1 Tax=Streptomyces europaeiscabiei TaxID=146819 RepID=UPI0038F7D61F